MIEFDDARLEDAAVLRDADRLLRPMAEAGARLRREQLKIADQLAALSREPLPRAVIAFGPESRLLRAVRDPACPEPFVAWPRLGLPTWVGPLDLVVAMGATNPISLAAAGEAVRRGARLLVACPADSSLAMASAARATTLLPTSADLLTCAVLVLDGLHRLGIGQRIDIEAVADAMDLVASECSALLDISANPAKHIALELAEAKPLVWGGSILAARASRRIAEALRAACGRIVLAADADALLPLLGAVPPRDLFADPFEDVQECRPGLVLLEDGLGDELAEAERRTLVDQALHRGVLVSRIDCSAGDRVTRYVTLLHHGLFAAAYLRIGLGDPDSYS
jgi:hypothetical protein